MLPVVVLAGGLGTRLHDVTGDLVPKALVEVAGRPFIDVKLEWLARDGVRDVLLLVGRHGSQIESHVGDGARFGLRVRYQHDGDTLLGTGGAIRAALPDLPHAFWVTYGDTLLDVDLARAESEFRAHEWLGLMTVLENSDRWERSNVRVEEGLVVSYRKDAEPGTHRFLDYGMLLLTDAAFDDAMASPFDLAMVFGELIADHALGAFVVTERFYDIGNAERLAETTAHLETRRSRP